MAVNLWFYHLMKFNYTQCESNIQNDKNSALNEFKFDQKQAVK